MTAASTAPILAVGAGRMGRGIAIAFAYSGYDVRIVDMKERTPSAFSALAADVAGAVSADAAFLKAAGLLSCAEADQLAARIRTYGIHDLAEAAEGVEFAFEGVPETLAAKESCLSALGEAMAENAIVASTTSTIDPNDLRAFYPHPARLLNAHWLNPAYLMPLVEISPHSDTAPETTAALRALLEGIGKTPITCKASPGYIVPRIQALAMNEAARLAEEGVASPEDIDKAIRIGFGLRFSVLGLLEFIDWGGCDILYHADRYLAENVNRERFAAPVSIETKMADKRRGIQDGAGFYNYDGIDLAEYRTRRLAEFTALLTHLDLLPRRRNPHS